MQLPTNAESPVLLGLGSNLGDSAACLREGVRQLGNTGSELFCSSLYRSSPVGYSGQPDFLNIVCFGWTALAPDQLLRELQRIESALGRTRPFPNAPRTIDIDILAYGDRVIDTPELTIPHPRLHQRGFVLVPLVEIAPDWVHPIFGQKARELLETAGPLEHVERVGWLPGW